MELTSQWEQRLWVVSLSRCWLLEGKKTNTVTMLHIDKQYYVEVCINIKAAYQRSNINGQVVYNTWSGEFVYTEAVHRRPTSTGRKVYMMMCMDTPCWCHKQKISQCKSMPEWFYLSDERNVHLWHHNFDNETDHQLTASCCPLWCILR